MFEIDCVPISASAFFEGPAVNSGETFKGQTQTRLASDQRKGLAFNLFFFWLCQHHSLNIKVSLLANPVEIVVIF